MSVLYKRVLNNSSRSVAIIHKGVQVNLPPGEHEVDASLADAFVAESPLVSYPQDDIGIVYGGNQYVDDRIWVANTTGNPDQPEKIKTKHWVNKQWQFVDVDNPVKAPRIIKKTMQGAMVEVIAKDGAPEGLNLLPQEIRLPPYTRAPLPKNIATWALNREGRKDKEQGVTLIKSRAPTDFEPNMGWSLDDMKLYLSFVDPDAPAVPSQADVENQNKKELNAEFRRKVGGSTKGKLEDLEEFVAEAVQGLVHQAKRDAMKRLFFRLADPAYKLPTRAQFEELKTGRKLKPKVEADDIGAVVDALNTAERQLSELDNGPA